MTINNDVKPILVIILALQFVSIGSVDAQDNNSFDRSSPSKTFLLIHASLENKSCRQVIESYSHQYKRFILFETVFTSGTAAGKLKVELDRLFAKYKLDIEKLDQEVKTGEELMTALLGGIDDLDQFLIDAQEILAKHSKPRRRPEIVDVQIEKDRAVLTYNSNVYSYTIDETGKTEEQISVHKSKIYLRKYGAIWRICPKGEWADPKFTWTVPNSI